jgi:hypothetical protein
MMTPRHRRRRKSDVVAGKIEFPGFLQSQIEGSTCVTKPVEREPANQTRELAADELECVSGGKPAAKEASGVMFLAFTFKLVAVK